MGSGSEPEPDSYEGELDDAEFIDAMKEISPQYNRRPGWQELKENNVLAQCDE